MKVRVGVSNRHIHLDNENYRILFGNTKMEVERELSEPGEYASNLFLTIKTAKSQIDKVRVIGPVRSYTQIEISRTDAYKLGINPPVRKSGCVDNSETVTLIGPNGSVEVNGCIIPERHIHISPLELSKYGFKEDDQVMLEHNGAKGGNLYNVKFKVDDNYVMEAHIDTDDANALMINSGDIVEIIKK